ncbi:MAG: PaaI family thioesterase [Gemmatimonadales bacterium]|nr:PaaI family thioesterase [Gemmatimonadales bacterium]MYG50474.1 PaaI family thioesterase [Gemmatimonadales bacterium]MYK02985.1 PaaI family thioesterase [Candidatus Palauibacter ramosifaciens]
MTRSRAARTGGVRDADARSLIESILADSEAIVALGVTLEELGEDTAVLRMAKQPELTRGDGTIYHGGPVASLIDIAGDMVVAVRAGGGVPTISLRVDYLRPCTGPYLLATARLRRFGRTISVSDIDVHDDQGRLCAVGRGTYSSLVG